MPSKMSPSRSNYGGALKAPRIREAASRLGDQARDAGWSHVEYLAAVLDREVSARDASGVNGSRKLAPSRQPKIDAHLLVLLGGGHGDAAEVSVLRVGRSRL